MKREISEKALALIKKMQQGEMTESVIYTRIAKFAKGEENTRFSGGLPGKSLPIAKSGKNIPERK